MYGCGIRTRECEWGQRWVGTVGRPVGRKGNYSPSSPFSGVLAVIAMVGFLPLEGLTEICVIRIAFSVI